MSREIKFRVWDEENKVYFRFNELNSVRVFPRNTNMYLDGRNIPNLEISVKTDNYQEKEDFNYKTHRGYILEQFTGLKDKNGREIYEGDIVLVREYKTSVWENVDRKVVWKRQRVRITGEVKFGHHTATSDDQYCAGKAYGWYLKLSRDPKDEYRKSVKESLDNADGAWSTNDFCSTKAKEIKIIGNIHENSEF